VESLKPLALIEDQPVDGRDGSDYLGMAPFARVVAATALGTRGPFTMWQGTSPAARSFRTVLSLQPTPAATCSIVRGLSVFWGLREEAARAHLAEAAGVGRPLLFGL
jgi:hypothetical protein